MKANFCIAILVTLSVFQVVNGKLWDNFVQKSNEGLDLIGKAASTFNVQTDEELVGQQLDRGFKQWRQDSKVSIKAGIPAALFEKTLRRKLGQFDIPLDYMRALESEIQDSYYVPQNVWKESSFIFSFKCKKHSSGGRKERRQRIRQYCRAVSRSKCKKFKKKLKMNANHQKGCPVYNIGLYISRNVECGTMNYVLVQSKIWLKMAADIFIIKKTTSVMGFSSGKITFKKRKQAMKPAVVKFVVDMAERVNLETIIKSSREMLQYNQRSNKCNPGLPYQGSAGGGGGYGGGYGGGPDVYTGPSRRRLPAGGPDVYTGPSRRRLRRGKNPRREIKQQCRSECEGEWKKWKCMKKCVQKKEREKLLHDPLLENEEKDRLCMEKCKALGQKWPEKPKCFNNCISGNIEAVGPEEVSREFKAHDNMMYRNPYAGGQWQPQRWRPRYGHRPQSPPRRPRFPPRQREGSRPEQRPRFPPRQREGSRPEQRPRFPPRQRERSRPKQRRPELTSGNGFEEGWAEFSM
jgi:hypothetical protein